MVCSAALASPQNLCEEYGTVIKLFSTAADFSYLVIQCHGRQGSKTGGIAVKRTECFRVPDEALRLDRCHIH
ncbi:MAG: hypothetical protein AMK74_02645 [Nitrospira bacterium SM23_35]|jgi:hypothetical protein|nr:MAG: hypothetical protein AMK74_02645 [Nitrospira bacterium SM23_35]